MDPRYLQDGPRKCWAVYAVDCNDLESYHRGKRVLDMIRRVGEAPHALKLNRDGSPAHPLYLRGDLIPFEIANEGNQCD
jgi:hypothetical protein